jgi:salicylate hydroxylase
LGFGQFLLENANEPLDQFILHGETGEELMRIDRRTCRDDYGAAYYQLHRADMLDALVLRFGPENCRMNHALQSLTQDEHGVRLQFEDGTEERADLVIGADGLRSVIRDILFDTPPPLFSGHVAWRALVPANCLSERAIARANINHVGTGKNLVTYPIRGRELVNIVALTRADDWAEESWSAKASPSELANIFAGWVDYVSDAIAAIAEDNLYRWGLFIREPLQRWVKGRVALLGDAAHPMLPYLGQGASSAIEDGIILGRCFAASSDPVEALLRYEKARIPRAGFLQTESNAGGDRLQSLNPYSLRDAPVKNEDGLGIFRYDPVTAELT